MECVDLTMPRPVDGSFPVPVTLPTLGAEHVSGAEVSVDDVWGSVDWFVSKGWQDHCPD